MKSIWKSYSLFIITCLLFINCNYKQDPFSSVNEIRENIPKLEKYISSKIRRFKIEKLSISIFENNNIIYSKNYWSTDDELFRAASISKPVVTYAALRLVEAGELELDAPLSRYLDNLYFDDTSKGNLITLRMVLNHTSGMSNYVNKDDREIYAEPGTEFHYSGAAFEYLKNVIIEITGKSFGSFMKDEVFEPLEMKNSRYGFEMIKGRKEESAAGGLITTADDISRFFMEIIDPKNISKYLIDEMISDSVKINANNSWGLGIAIQHGNGGNVIWHNGNNGNVWKSLAYISVDKKIGVVVLIKGKNGDKIYKDIVQNAIGGSFYGLQKNINVIKVPK